MTRWELHFFFPPRNVICSWRRVTKVSFQGWHFLASPFLATSGDSSETLRDANGSSRMHWSCRQSFQLHQLSSKTSQCSLCVDSWLGSCKQQSKIITELTKVNNVGNFQCFRIFYNDVCLHWRVQQWSTSNCDNFLDYRCNWTRKRFHSK